MAQMRKKTAIRRAAAALAVALLIVLAAWAPPRLVSAHAFLEESDPADNAILATLPSDITLRFTEPLERSYSQATLYDQAGEEVPGTTVDAGPDDFSMTLDIPPDLPKGTYSVLWQTLSTADGHTAQGYITFTYGSDTNVQSVVIPAVASDAGPPAWLQSVSRWIALLGLAATVAIWPLWLLVIRPGVSPAWQVGSELTGRIHRFGLVAIVFTLLGNLFALIVQAAATNPSSLIDGLATTVRETRYGHLWATRIALFVLYGLVLLRCAWWWPWRRRRLFAIAGLVLAALLPLPFSLISHASAQPVGRPMAVASDMAHLLGAALWAGGLAILAIVLGPTLRSLTPAGRKLVLGQTLPRFSAMALAAWLVMGITGLYSAWLQVGNWTALRETPYGTSLTLKLVLLVPLLMLAAFNLLVVTRKIRTAATGEPGVVWSRRFRAAVMAEVILVVVVFLVVGRLIGQAPAREELERQAEQIIVQLDGEDRDAALGIAPGITGVNHFRLEVGGDPLSPEAEAILRLDLPSQDTGQRQVEMTRAAGNAFEWHGSELALPGEWTIETIIRVPGQNDWTATETIFIDRTPPDVNAPGAPWRFNSSAIPGLLLLGIGIGGSALAWQSRHAKFRPRFAGLSAAVACIGLVLIVQARIDPAVARFEATGRVELDPLSVERGQEIYAANCLSCHGPAGDGDGPAAASLPVPPADLSSAHAAAHADRDMIFWVENGIAGSPMPAFGDTLSDAQIRDVIAYIRAMQQGEIAQRDAPDPALCQVAPQTVADLHAMSQESEPATVASSAGAMEVPSTRGTPVLPDGVPADANTVSAVQATIHEMVACSNARDTLRRLALFSDANLQLAFPSGPTDAFVELASTPPAALPVESRIAIVQFGETRIMPDGRVTTSVVLDNPSYHSHDLAALQNPSTASHQVAVVILVKQNGRWLIDEMIY
jgi:copper transport protein